MSGTKTATARAAGAVQAPRSLELAARRRRFMLHGGLAGALTLVLLVAPLGASDQRLIAITAIYTICVMGLNLVFGLAGQVTLGPAATFAVGAYAGGLFSAKLGWNVFAAVPVAMLAALVAGLAVGAPALRVGGFYLAMVTATAALTIPAAVRIFQDTTGGDDGLLVPPMSFGDTLLTDTEAYQVILVFTLLTALLVANVARTAWGRWFRCLKVSEIGTSALGVSVYRAKVSAFALSSVFGGLAGALYGPYQLSISPLQFGFDLSTAFFVAVVLGGLGSLWGPLLGVSVYYLVPEYLLPESFSGLWQQVLFGVAIVVVVVTLPNGFADAVDRGAAGLLRRLTRRRKPPPAAELPAGEPTDGRSAPAHRALALRTSSELPTLLHRAGACKPGDAVLEVRGAHKRFGGIVALDGASLTVRSGEITALIGPNGSGKTTLLNVCSGFLAPDAGTVALQDADMTEERPYRRARAGLSRTFQHPIIFGDLTGAENVMAGCADGRPGVVSALLTLPKSRRHERGSAERAEALLHALGAEHLITRAAGNTSLADGRILDLARALASDPVALLLDEPAAGLGLDEIAMLEALIRAARDSGVGVLLVEHDVAFVTRLADRVVALDGGKVIAEGDPAYVRMHPAVLTSYFGDLDPTEAEQHV